MTRQRDVLGRPRGINKGQSGYLLRASISFARASDGCWQNRASVLELAERQALWGHMLRQRFPAAAKIVAVAARNTNCRSAGGNKASTGRPAILRCCRAA